MGRPSPWALHAPPSVVQALGGNAPPCFLVKKQMHCITFQPPLLIQSFTALDPFSERLRAFLYSVFVELFSEREWNTDYPLGANLVAMIASIFLTLGAEFNQDQYSLILVRGI